jgi:hypothetical protein
MIQKGVTDIIFMNDKILLNKFGFTKLLVLLTSWHIVLLKKERLLLNKFVDCISEILK